MNRISRRNFLKAAGVGAAALGLAACGGSSSSTASINPNTMQRALAQLESEGLVRTERTSGRYVTEDTNLIEQLRAAAAHDIAADFLEKMRSIGYTPEKAAALLEHWDTEEVEPHE